MTEDKGKQKAGDIWHWWGAQGNAGTGREAFRKGFGW